MATGRIVTLRCAVIGDPIAHSRSPAIHARFAQDTGIALDYRRCHVAAADLASFVERFFVEGGTGLNVTLPHKQAVMRLCAAVAPAAQRAGSVNTLLHGEAGIEGESTDGPGLVADLERLGAPLQGQRIALIGAGGAARGVVEALLATAPAELIWCHRDPAKLTTPAAEFSHLGPLRIGHTGDFAQAQCALVLHATAAGHSGQAPTLPAGLLAAGGWAYDLSYGAAAMPFLDWARAQGAGQTADGMGMLIEQAALSFARWTGVIPDTRPVHALHGGAPAAAH